VRGAERFLSLLGKPVDVHGFLLRRSSSINAEKDFRLELLNR